MGNNRITYHEIADEFGEISFVMKKVKDGTEFHLVDYHPRGFRNSGEKMEHEKEREKEIEMIRENIERFT